MQCTPLNIFFEIFEGGEEAPTVQNSAAGTILRGGSR